MATSKLIRALLLSFIAATGGCAAYAVPGKGADFKQMGMSPAQKYEQTDPSINTAMEKKPLANFPAAVAIVRIQGNDYQSRTARTYGDGAYRVVLSREVEKPEQIERLAKLPMLSALEPINKLELPPTLSTDQELRQAAAALHADMVLIYTFDDTFEDRDLATVLTVLTIGVSPNKYLTVSSTVSAVLMDTRNGYIYGAAEATEKKSTLANCWGEDAAADAVREQVESAAFEKLVGEFQHTTWPQVVKQYAPSPTTKPGM